MYRNKANHGHEHVRLAQQASREAQAVAHLAQSVCNPTAHTILSPQRSPTFVSTRCSTAPFSHAQLRTIPTPRSIATPELQTSPPLRLSNIQNHYILSPPLLTQRQHSHFNPTSIGPTSSTLRSRAIRATDHQPNILGNDDAQRKPATTPAVVVYDPSATLTPVVSPRSRQRGRVLMLDRDYDYNYNGNHHYRYNSDMYHTSHQPALRDQYRAYTIRASRRADQLRQRWL